VADAAGSQRHVRRVRPVVSLINVVSRFDPDFAPRAQNAITRRLYEFVNRHGAETGITVMNYGYAPLGEARIPEFALRPEDEDERTGFQLYYTVANAIDLSARDVLEVGCGRGGGAAFVSRHLSPRSLTGIDFSDGAINYCASHHIGDGLRFLKADAESLPFPEQSFDVVMNIESSHTYPHVDRFLAEVHRVLRPSGHLLFADFRPSSEVSLLREQISNAGFVVLEEERITDHVVHARDLDLQRSQDVIHRSVPRPLRFFAREFFAIEGSETYAEFRSGKRECLRFVLQKP
ncbi:MAG TPA: methyltransferase domain-containing protein, partial [Thermomicrobiales bacterium]|nr:methyltransferase domain-containing protein [Thermomicrobiales bacterium]